MGVAVSSVGGIVRVRDFLQTIELYKGCILQITAEDGVADVDDNSLGSLSIL